MILVIRKIGRCCFGNLADDLEVGWRFTADHVAWWGRCTPEALDNLIADLKSDGAKFEIEDQRNPPADSVR